jgi:hypothetical protein
MDFDVLIPIVLFICITYAIKAVLDARTRAKLIATNGPSDLMRTLVENEAQQSRYASLRWGIVLVSLAVGFGLIQVFGWNEVTPGAVAMLLGATGVGNLVYYSIARNGNGPRQ